MADAGLVKISNSVIIGTVAEIGELLGIFTAKASVIKIEKSKIVIVDRPVRRPRIRIPE